MNRKAVDKLINSITRELKKQGDLWDIDKHNIEDKRSRGLLMIDKALKLASGRTGFFGAYEPPAGAFRNLMVTRDGEGKITGVGVMSVHPGFFTGGNGYGYLNFIGSTGRAPGVGSAIFGLWAAAAAKGDMELHGEPADRAVTYWQELGATYKPEGVGTLAHISWTVDQLKEMTAGLPKVPFEQVQPMRLSDLDKAANNGNIIGARPTIREVRYEDLPHTGTNVGPDDPDAVYVPLAKKSLKVKVIKLHATKATKVVRNIFKDKESGKTQEHGAHGYFTSGSESEHDPSALPENFKEKTGVDNLGERPTKNSKQIVEGAMSPEKYQRAVDNLQRFLDESKIIVHAPMYAALSILEDGRIKSQFETKTSGGFLSPGIRTDVENRLFGYGGAGVPNELRPIYGGLAINPTDPNDFVSNSTASYGMIGFVLKDGVKERTTITNEDSLIQSPNLSPVIMTGASPEALMASLSTRWTDFTGPLSRLDLSASDVGRMIVGHNDYTEAQIHGGVTLDDVEKVVVDYRKIDILYSSPEDALAKLQNLCDAKNVPLVVMNRESIQRMLTKDDAAGVPLEVLIHSPDGDRPMTREELDSI
jgi:hypothetical protein